MSPSAAFSLSFRLSNGDRTTVPVRRKFAGVREVVPVGESEKPDSS
jgi:hypothetical protein